MPTDHPEYSVSRRTLLTGAVAAAAAGALAGPAGQARASVGAVRGSHAVTFDKYSLMLDGSRLFVWSGEFHPFRLPSPSLWLDILQKMKASGYNAVCMYFDWNYHSPAPGVYDFSGVRDMDLVLDMAADVGLFVLTRPGPYINGEINGGGFPGWLTATPGLARSDDPTYLGYADQWLTAINGVITRHQITDGGGTVLLYQIENEYASFLTSPTGINYMSHLYAKARADGISVPIYHNDKGRNGDWIPGSFPAPDTNYLYAFDGYPSASGTPFDWGYFGAGGTAGTCPASRTGSGARSACRTPTAGRAWPGTARRSGWTSPTDSTPPSGSRSPTAQHIPTGP
jgi:hypothetical protein